MGLLLGKLRKKKSTYEVLEKLDSQIKSIEEFRRSTEQSHKKIVGRFILVSVLVYLVTAFIFYFYFFPASMYERLIYIIPLLSAPLFIISAKKLLTWYYNRKLNRNNDKLVKLREEKTKMLDTVMETETYKVAKSILEKFAPEQVRKPTTYNESTPSKALTPVRSSALASTQSGLRYRGYTMPSGAPIRQPYGGALPPVSTPLPARTMLPPPSSVLMKSQLPSRGLTGPPPAQMQLQTVPPGSPVLLPRAILPRDRTVLDKMVDYLVGDGPANRYALICKQCSSHNGMALREEFEYLSFRCCYCSTFNPARKQRPAAPKLELEMKTPQRMGHSDTSESERNSSTDIDTEDDNQQGPAAAAIAGRDSGRDSPDLKSSDIDKLSDVEPHLPSDEDYPPMEVDSPCDSHIDTANKQGIESILHGNGDVGSGEKVEQETETMPSGSDDATEGKMQD